MMQYSRMKNLILSKCNIKKNEENPPASKKDKELVTYIMVINLCRSLVMATEEISGRRVIEKSDRGGGSRSQYSKGFGDLAEEKDVSIDIEYNDRLINMYLFAMIL